MGRKRKIQLDEKYVLEQYLKKKRSTLDIGEQLGVTASVIRRVILRNGHSMRSKAQAANIYYQDHDSSMKGVARGQEFRRNVATGMKERWSKMETQKKKKLKGDLSQKLKKYWQDIDDSKKQQHVSKMRQGYLQTSKNGSKFENKLALLLRELDYTCFIRTHQYTPGNFEIDIAIPEHNVAIQVDGKTHFMQIFGLQHLQKNTNSDIVKNNILLNGGWRVIRILDNASVFILSDCIRVSQQVDDLIKSNFEGVKYIYVDKKGPKAENNITV